jgi:hypothetical protein
MMRGIAVVAVFAKEKDWTDCSRQISHINGFFHASNPETYSTLQTPES